jgi:hypothetical protein
MAASSSSTQTDSFSFWFAPFPARSFWVAAAIADALSGKTLATTRPGAPSCSWHDDSLSSPSAPLINSFR